MRVFALDVLSKLFQILFAYQRSSCATASRPECVSVQIREHREEKKREEKTSLSQREREREEEGKKKLTFACREINMLN